MKVCPRCAERVQYLARACRYCGFEFDLNAPDPPVVKSRSLNIGCGGAALIFLIVALVWTQLNPQPPGTTAAIQAVRDPAACDRLIAEGGRNGVIRRRRSSNRIDVEDGVWISLPADTKRGVMLALLCSHLRGRPPSQFEDYVVAYGYRSGHRLAMASGNGVRLE